MMRLQLLALAVAGCAAPMTAPETTDVSEPICHDAPQVVCSNALVALVTWNPATGPAPIPPFHTSAGVVVIFPVPGAPTTDWAFAVDGGVITAWIVFPGASLGTLVTQLTTSSAQLTSGAIARVASQTPQLAIIKPPVPTPPRLAAYVRQEAAYFVSSSATSQTDVIAACP